MAEWVTLLAGSVLVLVGFLASQLFERFRVPDYIVLIGVGIVLGSDMLGLGGWNPGPILASAAPLLLKVAIAFILFEGGLALNFRRIGRTWALAAGHAVVAMALTIVGVWVVGTYVLRLAPTTALILGIAMCAPSETIVLSFLPRLKVRDSTKFALTLEGVLGNVVATALVLTLVRFPGGLPGGQDLTNLLVDGGMAFGVAAGVGLAWDRVVGATRRPSFLYITSVALAVLLYAIGEGVFNGNGGLAAFAFGLVLGHWGPPSVRTELVGESPGSRYLQQFHRELVFLLRTFFFVFLGLRIKPGGLTWEAFLGAAVLVTVFAVARAPTVTALARAWRLPTADVRVLRAVVARGLTDTVLILYATSYWLTAGVVTAAEADAVTHLLFMVILVAAIVSAILVARAEPRPGPEPVPVVPAAGAPVPTALPLPPPPDDEPPLPKPGDARGDRK